MATITSKMTNEYFYNLHANEPLVKFVETAELTRIGILNDKLELIGEKFAKITLNDVGEIVLLEEV